MAAFLLRFSLRFESTVDFLRTSGFIIFVGYTFQAVAILIGLFLIWRVERLARTLAAAEPKEARTTRALTGDGFRGATASGILRGPQRPCPEELQ